MILIECWISKSRHSEVPTFAFAIHECWLPGELLIVARQRDWIGQFAVLPTSSIYCLTDYCCTDREVRCNKVQSPITICMTSGAEFYSWPADFISYIYILFMQKLIKSFTTSKSALHYGRFLPHKLVEPFTLWEKFSCISLWENMFYCKPFCLKWFWNSNSCKYYMNWAGLHQYWQRQLPLRAVKDDFHLRHKEKSEIKKSEKVFGRSSYILISLTSPL